MKKPLLLCLLMTALASAAWTPPEKPDPQKILHEAMYEDSKAGRNEDALAKFEWFHQNALSYGPQYTGVRVSFALGSWADLARTYPPAMVSLKKFRDLAIAAAKTGDSPRTAAREVLSFDTYLKDDAHAADFFTWLDANKPDVAKAVYSSASKSLIASKKFDLCGRYLQPDKAFDSYLVMLKSQLTPDPAVIQRDFIRGTAELVALLTITGKTADAETYAAKAREALPGNEALNKALEEAKKGTFPTAG